MTWDTVIRPQVETLIAGKQINSAQRRDLVKQISTLELEYNYLVSRAENYRRETAAQINDASAGLLSTSRGLLTLLVVLLVSATGCFVAGGMVIRRANLRQQAAAARLSAVNDELTWYAQIVQATDSVLLTTDPYGHITWVNTAFERVTGWSLDEVAGKVPTEVLHGPATDSVVADEMVQRLVHGESCRSELANYTKSGEVFWVAVNGSPVVEDDGSIAGFFFVQTDITERHEAELLMEQARRDAEEIASEKSAFLATMSHEIRTPLNAVIGLTELLQHTSLDEEQRDFARIANQSGNHLLALINDILDLSALESGKVHRRDETFTLGEEVATSLEMFRAGAELKGLALSLDLAACGDTRVRGDRVHLRQVMVNLIGNAIKFTDTGSVRVKVRCTGDGRAKITVIDTGIGIDADRIPSLFRSFVRGESGSESRYQGTGLGLAISKRLVELMGGAIELRSNLGQGTTVTLSLPFSPVTDAPASPTVLATSGATGSVSVAAGLRVLVVEDDPVNQKVIGRMLARLDVGAQIVDSGPAAIEAVGVHEYDLILMDLQMPGMDGIRATQLIRAELGVRTPRIVAVTANALAGDRDRFLAAGMDDYLSKPVTLASLTQLIERAVPIHG